MTLIVGVKTCIERVRATKLHEHPALQPVRAAAIAALPVFRPYVQRLASDDVVRAVNSFVVDHPVLTTYLCILGAFTAFPFACFFGFVLATLIGAAITFIIVESSLLLGALLFLTAVVCGCVVAAAGATAFAVVAYHAISLSLRIARDLFGINLLANVQYDLAANCKEQSSTFLTTSVESVVPPKQQVEDIAATEVVSLVAPVPSKQSIDSVVQDTVDVVAEGNA